MRFVLNPIVDYCADGKHLIPLHLRANGAVLSHRINTFLTRERGSGDLVYIFEKWTAADGANCLFWDLLQPHPKQELFPADLPANPPETGDSLGKFPLTLLGGPSGLYISFCSTRSISLE